MRRARGVLCLHAGLALGGLAATALLLVTAASAFSLKAPSAEALLRACGSFVLPNMSVASVLALVLGSVALAVLALGVRSIVRQTRTRRAFFRALGDLRLGPAGTLVFTGTRPQAFCAGLLQPRVYVSDGALALLTGDELEATLAHEAHHARMRDPLRLFVVRTLRDALFFLPALRPLAARYEALAEVAADAAAVRHSHGDPAPLASALLAFDGARSSAVVGIAPERVDHLLGERPGWELPVALLAGTLTIVAVIATVAVRVSDAAAGDVTSLPLVAAQLCMVAMVVVPLIAGAAAVLASRRAFARS